MAISEETPRLAEPANEPHARGSRQPGTLGLILRAVQVRLRFIVVLVLAFLVIGQWDSIRNRWDKLVRWALGSEARVEAVSADTEYFCPMDPGVFSDWPGKCSICNMSLVRRKRGDAVALPDGVVARMQLSPYRLQLAGVKTSPVAYQPLALVVETVGHVADGTGSTKNADGVLVNAELLDKDRALVSPKAPVEAETAFARGAHTTYRGEVVSVLPGTLDRTGTVRVLLHDPRDELRPATPLVVRIKHAIDHDEPYCSLPTDPPPHRKGEQRVLFACPEHPDTLREKAGRCTIDRLELEPQSLQPNQRVGWWCPMHPSVVAERGGAVCRECEGMALVPRVITYRPPGEVLSVPESAVVDTGMRTVVYVERMPGMFDGVEVVLGPRCGEFFPVVRGLAPGQRVATAGAFLIDAETRLNPSVAAAYFGAAAGATARSNTAAPAPTVATVDRTLSETQKVCPVTGKPLGSMGAPVRVEVEGQSVMICCEGCEAKLRKDPKKYLSKKP